MWKKTRNKNITQRWDPVFNRLLNIFVHKLLVELVSKTVVDEGGLLVVRLRPAAVLEHNIVVPPTFNLHVGLCGLGVLLLEERVPGENVFHPDPLLLIASLHLLVRLKKKLIFYQKYSSIPHIMCQTFFNILGCKISFNTNEEKKYYC